MIRITHRHPASSIRLVSAVLPSFIIIARLHAVSFTFAVTEDQRNFAGSGTYDTISYFRGVCEAIAAEGSSVFMVSPGDIDPPDGVRWTLDHYLGPSFIWYPGAGNHEAETPSDMTWLRAYNSGGTTLPGVVRSGPAGCVETTYSFDYGSAHFVMLNEYYNGTSDIGTDGDVVKALYDWLEADLAATTKQHIFVFGHEPAFVKPDMDNGRLRHLGDSLDKYPSRRDSLWSLFKARGVAAYICGHTHNASVLDTMGVFQIDAGHARGAGDTGAPSTYVLVRVSDAKITYEYYRSTGVPTWSYTEIVHVRKASVKLDVKTMLEGPYAAAGDTMTAVLAGTGSIPLTSPYAEALRTASAIPSNVTDWVLVQLRSSASDTALVSESVFLGTDGRLSLDGVSVPGLPLEVSVGRYYIVLKHRNHLSVMSSDSVFLSNAGTELYDFSTGADKAHGAGEKQLSTGTWGMAAGDADSSGTVDASDRSATWNGRNQSGYLNADCNLSGTVDASDRSITWNNRNRSTSVP